MKTKLTVASMALLTMASAAYADNVIYIDQTGSNLSLIHI